MADRNPDGTFARKKGGSDGGGATEREIENIEMDGGQEEKAEFIDSLDNPGLSASEGGSRIEDLMQAAQSEGAEPPEDVDPEAVEAARKQLEESGSLEDAQEALEQNLQAEEVAEAEEGEPPSEGVPFNELASELGFSDPQEAAESVTVTAKVDGEEMELSLSEALQGYQRQEAFTKKTQELAEQRREVEQKGEQYAQQLEMLATTIGQNLSPQQQQALVQEYQRVVSEVSDQTTPDPETVQEEQEQLRESFGWESEEEWGEARSNLRGYAHELGYSDHELSRVTDHRLLSVLEKARRYDAAQGNLEDAEWSKTGEGSRSNTVRPGSRSAGRRSRQSRSEKEVKKARKRAARTGRIDDAVEAIQGILAADEGS